MARQALERFYTRVRLIAQEEGFSVVLDSQRLCTPAGMPLIVPKISLAQAIAAEWRIQGRKIRPETMPLTQLTNTAIDHMSLLRQEGFGTLLALIMTDLVCYRATAPQELVAFQQQQWQPLLDSMGQRYGTQLRVTAGVMPIRQPQRVLSTLRTIFSEMDSFHLSALYRTATLCGSMVIALALVDSTISADTAFAATQLDQLFQSTRWGIDAATAARHSILYYELQNIAHFIFLLSSE